MCSNQIYGSFTYIKLSSHNFVLCFLGHSCNDCIAIAVLQRVIKQVWLRVIANPCISTGQPKFLLKCFDQVTPSSILSLFPFTYTAHSTAHATAWLGAYVLFKQSILTQKQTVSLILKANSHNKKSCPKHLHSVSSFNISSTSLISKGKKRACAVHL